VRGPGYLPGICWHLNPPPIEFTSVRDKLTPDYWPGICRRLKLQGIITSKELDSSQRHNRGGVAPKGKSYVDRLRIEFVRARHTFFRFNQSENVQGRQQISFASSSLITKASDCRELNTNLGCWLFPDRLL